MTNSRIELLTEDQCWERFHSASFGRIALYANSRVAVTPIRYVIVGGKFYFQTVSREKLSSIVVSRIAAVEIDNAEDDGTLLSVTARGTAHWHTHEIAIPELDAVRFGSVPSPMNWVEFVPESVSGYVLSPSQKH